MEISRSGNARQPGVKRSYWLANTAVTHRISANPSAALSDSTYCSDNKMPVIDSLFEILITVDSNQVTNLRLVANETCGAKINAFEIQPTKKPTQRLVRLRCFGKIAIAQLMSAVVHKLECAEFGRVHQI